MAEPKPKSAEELQSGLYVTDVEMEQLGAVRREEAAAAKAAKRAAHDEKRGMRRSRLMPVITLVVAAVVMLVLEVFYFVPVWDTLHRLEPLEIKLVSTDGGMAFGGGLFTLNMGSDLLKAVNATEYFTWKVEEPWTNDTDALLADLREEVRNETIWAAIVFPPQFTRNFVLAYTGASATYNNNSVEYICDEAKQYTTSAAVDTILNEIFHELSLGIRAKNFSQLLGAPNAAATAIAVRSNPVQLERMSLHTVPTLGVYFGSYVIFVVGWIATLFTCMLVHTAFRVEMTEKTRWPRWFVAFMRIGTIVVVTFFVALCLAGVLSGLGFPAEHGFGAVFGAIWLTMLGFAGFLCLFFSLTANVAIAIGILAIVLQLVTSDGIYTWHALPAGFRWLTWVLPMSHGVALMRYTGFDTCAGWMSGHLGVPFAWFFGGMIIACVGWYYRLGQRLIELVFRPGHHGFYAFSQLFA